MKRKLVFATNNLHKLEEVSAILGNQIDVVNRYGRKYNMMIITDSASDITKQETEEMGIRMVSLKIRFSDGEFQQNTEEDFFTFFEKLAAEKELPTTSQPSPKDFLELYEEAKEKKFW